MLDYYRRRASTYDGLYARPERQRDLRALEALMPVRFAGCRVLEIACGTGWWTPHGARDAERWLATDLNPEAMAIARARPLPACVEFRSADAWTLAELGGETFDAAFAGFWWSHVPLARLPGWLDTLHARLEPGARVRFIDNRWVEGSSTPVSRRDADGNGYQQRRLDDGSQHEVLKNFPDAFQAAALLGARARSLCWTEVGPFWCLDYERA